MKSYSNDPRTIAVKFPCKCKKCGVQLKKGVVAYYWPSDKTIYCMICGDADFQSFLSSAADEEVYNGTGNPY